MADGRVVMVTALPGFENVVVLDHGGGQYTLTARLWDIGVEEGQELEGGDLLGRVAAKPLDDGLGSTVYIELRHGEKPVDPTQYLKRARRRDE
jgi:septal ring factor EnvC (AmiA/AmiB activator)